MPAPPSSRLLRPSQLARFWELHPRTIHLWIRDGRLPAIRSPGNHFRVRIADARAFCEREGMPVPPFVSPPPPRAIVMTTSSAVRRALGRVFRGTVTLETFANPYEAVVAAACAPTAVLALDLAVPQFDAVSAVRALKRTPSSAATTVVAFHVPTPGHGVALERAGIDRILLADQEGDVASVLREILGLA